MNIMETARCNRIHVGTYVCPYLPKRIYACPYSSVFVCIYLNLPITSMYTLGAPGPIPESRKLSPAMKRLPLRMRYNTVIALLLHVQHHWAGTLLHLGLNVEHCCVPMSTPVYLGRGYCYTLSVYPSQHTKGIFLDIFPLLILLQTLSTSTFGTTVHDIRVPGIFAQH